MGTRLTIVDTDRMLALQSAPPIFINTVRTGTTEERAAFNEMIYSMYDGDVLNNVASCGCGTLLGKCNLRRTCTNCNHPVKARDASDIEPILWLKTPEGIGSRMINPRILEELCNHFTKNSFSIVRYLVDMSYPSECKIAGMLDYLKDKGIKRGYKYFYDNYDYVLECLFEHKLFRRKKNQVEEQPIEVFLSTFRDITFCDYLPLPNRTMLVIEENATGIYRDKSIEKAIDAARTVVGIDLPVKDYSARVKENRMIKTIFLLTEFVNNYIKNEVRGKPGVIRKHIIATRVHWAYRAVIVSNTKPHDYETIHAPWMAATSMLRLHLCNKLKKLGMTQRESTTFLSAHAQKYHPLIDRLFKELIAEAGGKGIPVLFVRNPSLMRGSIQRFFISEVKTDVTDPTTTLSILVINPLNADEKSILQNSSMINTRSCHAAKRMLNRTYGRKRLL